MNKFLQLESFLISSPDDAEKLKKSTQAKILVFSDSHGNSQAVKRIVSYFGKSVDCIAFCGDGISDLLSVEKGLLPPVVAFVRGNNDSYSYQDIKTPSELIFEAAGRKIFLTHGHRFGVYSGIERLELEAKVTGASLVLFGHTHVPQFEKKDAVFVNPGSIYLPRAHSEKSFAIVTVFAEKKDCDVTFYRIENVSGTEYYRPYGPEYFSYWGW